jgi:hypothetical protein
VRADVAPTKVETKGSETIISLPQEKAEDPAVKKDESSIDSSISAMGSYLGNMSTKPATTGSVVIRSYGVSSSSGVKKATGSTMGSYLGNLPSKTSDSSPMKTTVNADDASIKIETKGSEVIISLPPKKSEDTAVKKDESSIDNSISMMGSYLGNLSTKSITTGSVIGRSSGISSPIDVEKDSTMGTYLGNLPSKPNDSTPVKTSVRADDASTKIETKQSETIISLSQEQVDDVSEKKDETSLDSNISTMGSYLGNLSSKPTITSPVVIRSYGVSSTGGVKKAASSTMGSYLSNLVSMPIYNSPVDSSVRADDASTKIETAINMKTSLPQEKVVDASKTESKTIPDDTTLCTNDALTKIETAINTKQSLSKETSQDPLKMKSETVLDSSTSRGMSITASPISISSLDIEGNANNASADIATRATKTAITSPQEKADDQPKKKIPKRFGSSISSSLNSASPFFFAVLADDVSKNKFVRINDTIVNVPQEKVEELPEKTIGTSLISRIPKLGKVTSRSTSAIPFFLAVPRGDASAKVENRMTIKAVPSGEASTK